MTDPQQSPAPKTFKGTVKPDFRERMICLWYKECDWTRDEAIANYGGESFERLCERLLGNECEFNMDHDDCVEVIDNNFIIPLDAINITGTVTRFAGPEWAAHELRTRSTPSKQDLANCWLGLGGQP